MEGNIFSKIKKFWDELGKPDIVTDDELTKEEKEELKGIEELNEPDKAKLSRLQAVVDTKEAEREAKRKATMKKMKQEGVKTIE